jgi:membrane-associated HD superfamily phosphohydrolase
MMKRTKESARSPEKVDDLAYGQVVIVTARWILVLSGLLLVLWDPDPISTLRFQILLILVLAVANFYLHAQALMRRPVLPEVIRAASVCDLLVITLILVAKDSFQSNMYVFYFPAIAAFSVVFTTTQTILFTGSTCVLYTILCLFTGASGEGLGNFQVLFTRLVILVAVAVVGNAYARIERGRRQAAEHAREDLMLEIGKHAAANGHSADHVQSAYQRS